jgi:hypothetical protein
LEDNLDAAAASRVPLSSPYPIIIGGDFNIIRSPVEKNNENYSDR